ncbi:RluA family pseudouridine synthase [Texcoconibacillus texcoconensis]|uniref:Pseudouridine synthase n=1 Tax=Texcoconibacillus texcoconensis TaxID=1095777 RepID=A0A840QLB4_9BACI|nr:RluA family pseudouridine synthase [Texcoconibacillus texcoconensis]MBB5172151.1 23S rRNA pseudouridine1911/1915/1917 synthase [Texcoconibacillus texcoconensis]
MMEHTFTFQQQNRIRIDKWLIEQASSWSRSGVQKWIKDGQVTVNGKTAKASDKLHEGDVIVVYEPEAKPVDIQPELIPLDIVYEDSDLLVVNKRRGMVVHPSPGHQSGTLVNALLAHCDDLSGINGEMRPGIVHRIDKDTSGLLVVAKSDAAHVSLAKQLEQKLVERKYFAIVNGTMKHDEGTIDAPIGRDPNDRQKYTVTSKNAKDAVTHFEVQERLGEQTLVACHLETGRTHQIRVHFQYIKHPIIGDPKYGPRRKMKLPIEGQALHAGELRLKHPKTNEEMTFTAPLPDDFSSCLGKLRQAST